MPEIIKPDIKFVPLKKDQVCGKVTSGDHPAVLVNLHKLFGIPVKALTADSRLIVLEQGSSRIMILTDKMLEILTVSDKEELPFRCEQTSLSTYSAGIYDLPGREITLLNDERLFTEFC